MKKKNYLKSKLKAIATLFACVFLSWQNVFAITPTNNCGTGAGAQLTVQTSCVTTPFDFSSAVGSPTISGCGAGSTQDGWGWFTATGTSTTVTATPFTGFGGNRNIAILIYSGSCVGLVSVGCVNATTSNTAPETITFATTSGNPYFVRIVRMSGTAGTCDNDVCVIGTSACAPTVLTSGVAVSTSTYPTPYSWTKSPVYTGAVAIAPQANDHDVAIYSTGCQGGTLLANSQLLSSTVDYIIQGWQVTSTVFPSATFVGSGGASRVEAEVNAGTMILGTPVTGTIAVDEVMDAYEAPNLTAGTLYNIKLTVSSGNCNLGFGIGTPLTTSYLIRSSCTNVDANGAGLSETLCNYNPSTTGFPGIVLFNTQQPLATVASNYSLVIETAANTMTSANSATICSGGTASIALTSSKAGSTFTWQAADNPNTTGESTSLQTTSTLSNTITNNTTSVQTVTYTVTPISGATSCSGTAQTVTVTVNPSPTAIAGGAVAAICQGGTSAGLGGSFNGSATAAIWNDGGAGGSFANNGGGTPGTATYTASPTSGTPVTLTLVTSGGSCGIDSDNKQITVNPNPTAIAGGAVADICQGGTTAALGGSFGGGATAAVWNDGGAGGSFANNGGGTPNTATYTASPTSGTPVTLTLVTSGGSCGIDSDNKQVNVNASPSVSDAGPDQFKCTSTATLAAVSPSVGTGAWTVVSGGGTVTSPGSPNSGVTGLTPGTNEFKWTVSNGVCTPEEDNVIIDVTPPTSSDAGADQSLCNATTGTLAANTPVNGSGVWTVLAGGSTVDVPTDPNSTVSNLTPGTNTFRWTITHLTCASANDADIKIRTAVPAQPVSISAPPSVCPPVTGVNISVPAAADADNYTWTVSPGTNGVTYQAPANQANVVADFATTTNSTYGIRVAAVNSCGAGNHIATIIRRSVSTPSAISGPSVACAGDSKTYSIGAVNGADNYTWGAPAGSTINGQPTPLITTATSVVVVFPGGFTTGNITVSSMVACFTSPQRTLLVKNSPNAPVSLSGTFKICPGSTGIAYSVPGVVGAASYNWTLPAGATLASGAGTNAITVNWPSNYNLNQNVCGYAVSSCGASSTGRCKSVSSIVPQTAGTMSGTATGACGETGNYSVGAVSNADVYTWTVPSGVAINSGQGSNTINVTYNGNVPSGNICVTTTNNSCAGNNAPRCKNVSTTPSNPGPITPQPSSFCAFDTGIEFSVAIVNGASGYQWTVPAGAVIQSGQGSNSIIVNWGANGGNVTVRAINACGNGGTRALNITLTCKTAPQSLTSDKPSFDLQVRPNPSHGEITVSFESSNTNPAWLIITDLSGREILKQLVDTKTGENQYEMDLSQLAKGIYLLNLRSQNNNGQLPIVIE